MELTSPVLGTMLRPFLFDNTGHFLHELLHFARSPLDMRAYDRRAQYDDGHVAPRVVCSTHHVTSRLHPHPHQQTSTHDPHHAHRQAAEDLPSLAARADRAATPPHMAQYARAIRHMLLLAEREGAPIDSVADRPAHIPHPSVLQHTDMDDVEPARRSRSPARRRRRSPAAREPVAKADPSSAWRDEIAHLEAALTHDRAQLASLLLRRELRHRLGK